MLLVYLSACSSKHDWIKSPNIIIIYADDLGLGDVSCYGSETISTPNIDSIANQGIRFNNVYATSATCTPSRYALLTGEYPWRNERAHILPGNAPLLIDTSQLTLPKMLRGAGYQTGVVGKWHLGLGGDSLDWNGVIQPGPNDVGFDYSFVLASTNDRVPTVYVENDGVYNLDVTDSLQVNYESNFEGELTGRDNPELLKILPSNKHDMSIHNGISRLGYQKGGESARFIDEYVADTILNRAIQFIERNQDDPFFLYYALHQPHVPRVPNPRLQGSSGMGPRGDVIIEADWCVGQLMNTLEQLDLTENTIIIFSSDNGPVLDDGYQDMANELLGDHDPNGGLRGGKYSLFDAGTHVPFLVSWPGQVEPAVSDVLVCQMDLMASLAKLVGQNEVGRDSKDLLDVLLGKSDTGRDQLVIEAMGRTAYIKDDWVMIPPYKGVSIEQITNIELGNSDHYQLFNLEKDPYQQNDVASFNSGRLEEMIKEYRSIVD